MPRESAAERRGRVTLTRPLNRDLALSALHWYDMHASYLQSAKAFRRCGNRDRTRLCLRESRAALVRAEELLYAAEAGS